MNAHSNTISQRLSLRPPQRESLDILARIADLVKLEKGADPVAALNAIREEFPSVVDFEREFPSLAFALATGVGKTRLMGAFIAYLFRAKGWSHFFVLAPNLTIYNKLIQDFTPGTPKYVFQGIGEFALTPPLVVTSDNFETGIGVRRIVRGQQWLEFDTFENEIHINIFNISKINSEVRGDKEPKMKRLRETIGESYFAYLSKLDDLVLLMDEAHRYRASAGVKAINELKPILGLELTATPQVEKGSKSVPFKNVIYAYPLSKALADGFVKEPAVATRENFDAKSYSKEALELLKLKDAVSIHEETKVQLDLYAKENGVKRVKPFMLVVAEDTTHASALKALIESDEFYSGQYRGKVIEVHSQQKGEEKDENVQQLLSVEDPANVTEIVIHVNMLKEGWDVTNLYTIVPLRAANSKTLVEQSIGRGLRLPYGVRVGVPAVDRLTIVAHDRFQEIIDEANKPDSVIRQKMDIVYIGRDVATGPTKLVTVESTLMNRINGTTPTAAGKTPVQLPFATAEEKEISVATVRVMEEEFRRVPPETWNKPAEVEKLMARVAERVKPTQPTLFAEEKDKLAEVVRKTLALRAELSMDIPRITVVPKGDVQSGYREFELDCTAIHLQPVSQEILIQHLSDRQRFRLGTGGSAGTEARLEDYLVGGLVDFDDIDYDSTAPLLYKLAGQVVAHLRTYLKADEVENVLIAHRKALVDRIHAAMQDHYYETATEYEVHVTRGFQTLRANNFAVPANEEIRDFRDPVAEKLLIRGMLFGGFAKCLYPTTKFQSNSERLFSVVLENDATVLKWFRPNKGDFRIDHSRGEEYVPDFAAELVDSCILFEVKARNELESLEVLAKAKAAKVWCEMATKHGGGKVWRYALVPHDVIDEGKTVAGLTQ